MIRPAYHDDACVSLIVGILELAVTDYKNICKSGWLVAPFKLRQDALTQNTKASRNPTRCAMHRNESARELMAFLSGEYMDRVLALAGLDLDADRVRGELVNFYHKHN